MSHVGFASQNASSEKENSPYIHEDAPQLRHPEPPLLLLLLLHVLQKELRIQVPRSPHKGALGDAFQYQSPGSAELPDFNTITQLPTPVLPSGGFKPRLPTRIEVRKRNMAPIAAERSRIVSAFAPESATKLGLDTSPVLSKSLLQTRHISNPVGLALSASDVDIPLAPLALLEPDADLLKGRVLLAPNSGTSYVCEEIVGTGAFSTVVRAHETSADAREVAVKIVSYPRDECTTVSSFRSFIVRELGILANLRHPCIVTLLDYNVSASITLAEILAAYELGESANTNSEDLAGLADQQQYFFLEYCAGGNLFTWLSAHYKDTNNTLLFWRLMARIVAELVVSVAHMHKRRIIHRDIKLENILLNNKVEADSLHEDPRLSSRPVATLTDFGLSKRLTLDDQLLTTKCGSQDYVSPELLMGLKYNGKLLDAWAIGVLVYSIIENRLPFDLPPPELMPTSGISPSVLRRRRSKQSPAHRIAMIEWDWYRATGLLQDNKLDGESRKIVQNLQALVEAVLVRKEKRISVEEALAMEKFAWIKACVPTAFYS